MRQATVVPHRSAALARQWQGRAWALPSSIRCSTRPQEPVAQRAIIWPLIIHSAPLYHTAGATFGDSAMRHRMTSALARTLLDQSLQFRIFSNNTIGSTDLQNPQPV